MTQTIFYALIFLFEVSVCFFYFEYILQPKRKLYIRIPVYLIAGLVQFGGSFLSIPGINLITFVISTVIIVLLLYQARLRTCLFQTALLTALMLITELVAVSALSATMKVSVEANDLNMQILQGSLGKLLFTIAVFFAARLTPRRERRMELLRTLALAFFPISSIVLLWMFYDIVISYDLRDPYTQWFVAGAVLLLFSNIIIFAIYESTQKTHFQNTQLQLELQREKISSEYYELLQREYENTRILAHDFKGHLHILKDMALEGRGDEISGYIDSLGIDFRLYEKIAYSANRYVNVIINRYVQLSREQSIQMDVDIQRASLEFMSGNEVTALLDNLLSNAVEAAADSQKKRIELVISEQNVNFVVIQLRNSSDAPPKTAGGELVSKKKVGIHGLGVKSIQRIVKKYNGTVRWDYHPDEAEFECSVILKEFKMV